MPHKVQQLVPEQKQVILEEMFFWRDTDFSLDVFDEKVIAFFDHLSKQILRDKEVNRRPEISALAFWLRRSNLEKIKTEHGYWFQQARIRYQPIGKVFHVCPANVDTMFMYSWAISLLCGNKNILRISKRIESFQVSYLFDRINEAAALPEYQFIRNYVSVISYDRDNEVSNFICSNVNARIIWGGDATVNTFKSFGSAARIKDISFADRISFSVMDAQTLVSSDEKQMADFVQKFYNDSYTFDQLGCSSPQSLCFLGKEETCKKALEVFSKAVTAYARDRYQSDMASLAGLKLNKISGDAIEEVITEKKSDNNLVMLVHSTELNLSDKTCGAGYFYYSFVEKLSELAEKISSKNQTLTYFGLTQEQLEEIVDITKGKGIDRVVPIGMGLEFNYIWDGYRLTEELTAKKFVV